MTSEEREARMVKEFEAWKARVGIQEPDSLSVFGAFVGGFAAGHECGMEEANAMFMKHLERSIASLTGGK